MAFIQKLLFLGNRKDKYIALIPLVLLLLLVLSIFKNISYPLFWADESMTVMGGVRVLQFGYPKVHDGKNVFYDLVYEDKSLGIDPKTDAYIGGANWGQYYIAAIGVKLAEMSDNIFVKTGIIRSVFALLGMTGILLLALLVTHFYQSNLSKMAFLALFLFLTLISVPLALHLREARYYALTLFSSSAVIYIYARYRILEKMRCAPYSVLLAVSLIILFLAFSPAFFVFVVAIALFEAGSLVRHLALRGAGERARTEGSSWRNLLRHHFLNILPCLISLAAVYPLFRFFDIANISAKLSKYYADAMRTTPIDMYMNNLSFIWDFFASSGLIYLAIFLKIVLLGCFLGKIASIRNMKMPELTFSIFLSVFFVVYSFAIARIPNPLFARYFINLQPVLTIILLMDMTVILKVVRQHHSISGSRSVILVQSSKILTAVFVCAVILNISVNLPFLKGHIFELTRIYKGPLDYIIPFIRDSYGNTENLVIATNYEETSFMYYLGAKVIVGYSANNIEADAKMNPDIIVFRNGFKDYAFIFNMFLKRNIYGRVRFPVYNSLINNIPELDWDPPFQHRFETQNTEDNDAKASVYVRK